MSWLRLDDGFCRNRKLARLSDRAFRLHVSALCECASQLTDGAVDAGMLAALPNAPRGRALQSTIQELLDAGLWEENGNDYAVHDFLDWNPSGSDVRAKRDAAKERMRAAREAKTGRSSREQEANKPAKESECSREQDANRARSSHNPVPVPVPSGSKEPPPPTPSGGGGGGQPLSDDELLRLSNDMLGGRVSVEVLRRFVVGETVPDKGAPWVRSRVTAKLRDAEIRRELIRWTEHGDDAPRAETALAGLELR